MKDGDAGWNEAVQGEFAEGNQAGRQHQEIMVILEGKKGA